MSSAQSLLQHSHQPGPNMTLTMILQGIRKASLPDEKSKAQSIQNE